MTELCYAPLVDRKKSCSCQGVEEYMSQVVNEIDFGSHVSQDGFSRPSGAFTDYSAEKLPLYRQPCSPVLYRRSSKTFTPFKKLPSELQIKIYQFALAMPRVLRVKHSWELKPTHGGVINGESCGGDSNIRPWLLDGSLSPLLSVCHLSRHEALICLRKFIPPSFAKLPCNNKVFFDRFFSAELFDLSNKIFQIPGCFFEIHRYPGMLPAMVNLWRHPNFDFTKIRGLAVSLGPWSMVPYIDTIFSPSGSETLFASGSRFAFFQQGSIQLEEIIFLWHPITDRHPPRHAYECETFEEDAHFGSRDQATQVMHRFKQLFDAKINDIKESHPERVSQLPVVKWKLCTACMDHQNKDKNLILNGLQVAKRNLGKEESSQIFDTSIQTVQNSKPHVCGTMARTDDWIHCK